MPVVTWDPSRVGSSVVLSNGNLTAAYNGAGTNSSVLATLGRSVGKYFFEIAGVNFATNTFAVGFADPSTYNVALGMIGNSAGGSGADNWGYYATTGDLLKNSSSVATYGTYTTQTMGIALDLTNHLAYFHRAGAWQNSANPVAGTGGVTIAAGTWFPGISVLGNTGGACAAVGSFGASGFLAKPSGFLAWDQDMVFVPPPADISFEIARAARQRSRNIPV
jgi:hypothetical protein